MSFISKELSKFLSRPVELYHFNTGVTDWYFTSSDKSVVYNDITWIPQTLNRSSIKNSNDLVRSNLSLSISQVNPLRDYVFSRELKRKLTLRIYRLQLEENESKLMFKGDLGLAEVKNELEISLTFQQIGQFAINNSQRYTYGTKCNHDQYGSKCGLDLNTNSYTVTAINIIENEIKITNISQEIGIFKSGIAWFSNGSLIEKRSIIDDFLDDEGNRIIKLDITFGSLLNISDQLKVAKGCKNDSNGCKSLNNFNNFLGFEYIPRDNYFTVGIIDEGKGTASGSQQGSVNQNR